MVSRRWKFCNIRIWNFLPSSPIRALKKSDVFISGCLIIEIFFPYKYNFISFFRKKSNETFNLHHVFEIFVKADNLVCTFWMIMFSVITLEKVNSEGQMLRQCFEHFCLYCSYHSCYFILLPFNRVRFVHTHWWHYITPQKTIQRRQIAWYWRPILRAISRDKLLTKFVHQHVHCFTNSLACGMWLCLDEITYQLSSIRPLGAKYGV